MVSAKQRTKDESLSGEKAERRSLGVTRKGALRLKYRDNALRPVSLCK